ncbi:hypothetical protein [Shewanella colwelliana]|uniref:hypothetical protein n=1 Tax=Shewanella colwelliana TaxID=23 RepID=UPI0022AF03D7|nr:hypothetical protein [Shewanella colwelliana]MCZ4339036.1 hypothetical protein [Shewanella colwelliana]
MMKGLKIAHWLGVFMLATGIMLYSFTALTQEVSGILLISCLIGLGLVLMSPFPMVLFIQWARAQENSNSSQ